MFTVIIAEQSVIDLYEEFKPFLGQLFRPSGMAFCRWNREGKNLEEMLPDLNDKLRYTEEWRAVIVHPDGINQKNPFDMVHYQEIAVPDSGTADTEPWLSRRRERFRCYEEAEKNPLTRLLNGLYSNEAETLPVMSGDYKQIIDGDKSLFCYRLEQFLIKENSREIAERLRQFYEREPKKLECLVEKEKINELLMAIQEKQSGKIRDLLRPEDQERFLRLLSRGEPFLEDPEFYETLLVNAYKASLRRQLSEQYRLKDHPPFEVVCTAARTYRITPEELAKKDAADASRILRTELDFVNYNMYPESVCYVLFDLVEEEKRQYLFDRMKMMAGLLLLAGHDLPSGFGGKSRLYRANLDLDAQGVQTTCAHYLEKLSATMRYIEQLMENSEAETAQTTLSQQIYRDMFESENVVRVSDLRHTVGTLKAEENVPLTIRSAEEATASWKKQYNTIFSNFMDCLRRPAAELEKSVANDFRKNNRNEDERAGYLSDTQKSDLEYHMLSKEHQMVCTETPRLFEPDSWQRKMEQEEEKVRTAVSQRLTTRQILCAFGAAALFCFIGFSSLLITNLNTIGSFLFSLILIAAVLLILGGIAAGYVFLMRRKYIEVLQDFNKVMEELQGEIRDGLERFKEYLSHACNMMRDSSALNRKEKPNRKRLNTLQYHKQMVMLKQQEAGTLFYKYAGYPAGDRNFRNEETPAEPYPYDFFVMSEYPYEMPDHRRRNKKITFVQKGHEISIPLEYICSFLLESEEMYDRN